jgi:phosphatidylinositol dimannoside acyltransferase
MGKSGRAARVASQWRRPLDALRTDGPFWRGLASLTASHAPEPVIRFGPPGVAFAFALALPGVRARVRQNLRAVLGPRAYHEELIDVFRTFSHFASCFTESLALGAPEPHYTECAVEGGHHLEQAMARGRGVIAVTAHTGAWETAGPLLKKVLGADMLIAMEREPDERARAIQDQRRQRAGVRIAHVGTEPLAVLPLFTHLRRGGVLGVQLDRAPSAMRSIPVRLFDRDACVPSGPFWLSRATGAPIVPVFAYRRGHFRYEIRISRPHELARDASQDVLQRSAQEVTAEMERFIRQHPTHWFHFGPNGDSAAAPERPPPSDPRVR